MSTSFYSIIKDLALRYILFLDRVRTLGYWRVGDRLRLFPPSPFLLFRLRNWGLVTHILLLVLLLVALDGRMNGGRNDPIIWFGRCW